MTSVSTDRRYGVNSSMAIKAPCIAATTGNITLSGEQTIDGISCVTGDRVLVKGQTAGADNGIYIVDTGSWERAPDFDGSLDVAEGTLVEVNRGTINGGYAFRQTAASPVIGTTSLAFTQAFSLSTFYQDVLFPSFRSQQRTAFRANVASGNSEPTSNFGAINISGTVAPTTLANFIANLNQDICTYSGWTFRGGAGTNFAEAANFGLWLENASAQGWAVEIDVQNETGATGSIGDDTRGIGLMLNTGSTYSPDTAIKITRATGAGTGPGYRRGLFMNGVRDTAIQIEAMASATYPGMSPAAPGSIVSFTVGISNEAQQRFYADQNFSMFWGGGAAVQDIQIARTGVSSLDITSDFNSLTNTTNLNLGSGKNSGFIANLLFNARNSSAAVKSYCQIIPTIADNTAASEDGQVQFWNYVAGTSTNVAMLGAGLILGAATGGDEGTGTINIAGSYYANGTKVVGARDTGWTAMTGTPDKATAYATSTVTLAQLAGRVMSLQAALTTHGLIGS